MALSVKVSKYCIVFCHNDLQMNNRFFNSARKAQLLPFLTIK
ncbi:MAG: hypothetical protein DRR19_33665 [Candidatus Parabeggiatoa sp. nov. 1]|nr:MAG: hypothetical protein DRR19_33665 [Gammaproteobacteria bacterium]